MWDVYHWDTFDNVTIRINARGFKSLPAAQAFVKRKYGKRLRGSGADRVDIVERATGKVTCSYTVG
jgi:hypothetical protein